MILDCHTHIGRNKHISATVEQLIESMDKSEIDKSLVFAGKINDCPNEFLLEEIKKYPNRLFGVAAYHEKDTLGERDLLIKHLKAGSFKALKFYLGYDHWYPDHVRIRYMCSLLEKLNIPAIFHTGDCLASITNAKLKYAHPLGIDEIAVDFPDLKIIMAHVSFPWQRDCAEVCYKNKNVYADISGFVYGDFTDKDRIKFDKVLNEFIDISHHNKLLFGTDWPISNQKSYVETMLQTKSDFLSIEESSKISTNLFNL